MTIRNNLRLASFDGGGIRGLSQLEIMNRIVYSLNFDKQLNGSEPLLPCEYFDLMGGSGTGGLIAIMFAKLRMTVEEASEEFCTIAEIYNQINITPRERTQRLKGCVEDIMKRRGLRIDMKLLDRTQVGGCECFVVTSRRINAGSKSCLRSYPLQNYIPSTATVVEAVLATCATQPMFAPVSIGVSFRKVEYIGAGLGANNPINEVITEAHSRFGGNSTVTSLLSVGCGHPGIVTLPSDGSEDNLYRAMQNILNDCMEKAREIKQRIGRAGIYHRFSVEQGMQNDQPFHVLEPGWIGAQTESYMDDHLEQLDAFTKNNDTQINFLTINELKSGNFRTISPTNLDMMNVGDAGPNNEGIILTKLKPSNLGAPAVGECMEGTRREIFASVLNWALDFDAANIFWVKGHPGVGKSAIAVSLTEKFRELKRLGSSFFFQRELADAHTPNTLWRVIAYDLARKYPAIRKQVLAALMTNETLVTTLNTERLFLELIHKPLTSCDAILVQNLPVIVIDALDECGGLDRQRLEHRANLRHTLKSWSNLPKKFKLVVTSREEADIEQLFKTIGHSPLEIHAGKAAQPHSLADIKKFLEHKCREIVKLYEGRLPPDWPKSPVIQELTSKSEGLFIWVTTIIEFLNHGEPQEQLSRILAGTGAGGMAALYSWILKAAFPYPSEKVIQTFRSFVGTIIVAKESLSALSIKDLCSTDESMMNHICNRLQSVMTSGDVPRFKHQSLVDFLIDREHCPEIFLIDRDHLNRELTLKCLSAMKRHRKFNICGIESSYYQNSKILGLDAKVKERISPHVAYSCCFWTSHLTGSAFDDDDEVYKSVCDFMENQFLFWMEVLSLTECINRGSSMMQLLIN